MSDIQIIMADGRNLREFSAEERKAIFAQFAIAYVEELEKDVRSKPDEYAWADKSHEEVQRVASRMIDAIYHGRANNSNALKRAAKRIGLNGAMKYNQAFVQQCLEGNLAYKDELKALGLMLIAIYY